jgi:hypothetical protein
MGSLALIVCFLCGFGTNTLLSLYELSLYSLIYDCGYNIMGSGGGGAVRHHSPPSQPLLKIVFFYNQQISNKS